MNKERYNQIIDEVYRKYADSHWTPPSNPKGKLLSDQLFSVIPMEHSKESFINKCKVDSKFSERWGLKIEERELSLEERYNLIEEDKHTQFVNWQSLGTDRVKEVLDELNIPTKLITLTYNNEKIESYEKLRR